MKKIIVIVIVVVLLGVGYWLISPLFIDKQVSESLPVESIGENTNVNSSSSLEAKIVDNVIEIKAGFFSGFDAAHTGSGRVRLIKITDKNYIRFENDFKVSNGPDLYVGLGANGAYLTGSELGRLKGNIGSQNYELPADLNPESVSEVWVWCRAFSVPFAKAVFVPSVGN